MGRYGRDGQATDYNITVRMRFVFWVNIAKDTDSEYAILYGFPQQE